MRYRMRIFVSIYQFSIVWILSSIVTVSFAHSGLYGVNTTKVSKDFSAAWLISRSRFVNAEAPINTSVSMASVTFSTIRQRCKNCKTLVTRDFLDFMVEHLSSATNQLPNDALFPDAIERLENTAKLLQQEPGNEHDPRLEKTIGILVYSSICFSKVGFPVQKTIRPSFFKATFWSLHRYIKDIVVYVANEMDKQAVIDMNLPYKKLTQLVTPLDYKNRTNLLPRDSLMNLLHGLKNNETFYSKYEYVFFSEGDQIVHMREPGVLFDVIDNSGGTFLTVPHRMQSLTLTQDFPEERQILWPKIHAQNAPDVIVAKESINAQGSCCGNGDVDVAPCKGWWYQCPTYGIRDFPTWLKFGEFGLTMPPVTEHKATCEYSPVRRQCPLPPNCGLAIPTKANKNQHLTYDDVCGEIHNMVYMGPETAKKVKVVDKPALESTTTVSMVKYKGRYKRTKKRKTKRFSKEKSENGGMRFSRDNENEAENSNWFPTRRKGAKRKAIFGGFRASNEDGADDIQSIKLKY